MSPSAFPLTKGSLVDVELRSQTEDANPICTLVGTAVGEREGWGLENRCLLASNSRVRHHRAQSRALQEETSTWGRNSSTMFSCV